MYDPPTPLEYARPNLDKAPGLTFDAAIAVLSALQASLGAVYVIALLTDTPPIHDTEWAIIVAGTAAYTGLSIVALVGSLRAVPHRRRPFYRAYLIGLPVLVIAAAAIVVARAPGDRGACGMLFVMAGIIDPAWLLLVVRRMRRSLQT